MALILGITTREGVPVTDAYARIESVVLPGKAEPSFGLRCCWSMARTDKSRTRSPSMKKRISAPMTWKAIAPWRRDIGTSSTARIRDGGGRMMRRQAI